MKLKTTIINLVIVVIVLALLGVEPLSTYKNNILSFRETPSQTPVPQPTPMPLKPVQPKPSELKIALPSAMQLKIHELVNIERKEIGLRPVKWSNMLAKNAQSQAEYCAEVGYMVHSSRYAFQGGENLVYTTGFLTAEKAVNSWMSSTKGHREYLLSPRVKYAGVGIASKNGKTFAAWAFADMALFTEFGD